jgi:hypothetical protein
MPESVVIVKYPKGWVANVRYADRTKDINLSSHSRVILDAKVDELFRD